MNAVLHDARRGHAGLFWLAVTSAGLAVLFVGLAVVDQRTVLGAPVWIKPLKFAISFAAYSGALAWMLGQLREPVSRRTGWVIVAASAIEMVIIAGQAARGVRSHFNDDTVADVALFAIIGDLRIGHFVGLHALQVLPLLGFGLAATRLGGSARSAVVTVAAVGYGALVVLLTWQALRGQPLLAPDPLTRTTLAVLVTGTAGAALAAVRSRPRQPSDHA